jgi:hypothetical protein
MWQGNRAADNEFDRNEYLYHRITKDHLEYTGDPPMIISVGVRNPDFSVNRGKYSSPTDVLIGPVGQRINNIEKMGIFGFTYEVACKKLNNDLGQAVCEVTVLHEPDWDNYSHSGVKAYVKDSPARNKVNKAAWKKYRAELARLGKLFLDPQI